MPIQWVFAQFTHVDPKSKIKFIFLFLMYLDCIIIGICAMLLYLMVGLDSKSIYKSWSTNVVIFFIWANGNFFLNGVFVLPIDDSTYSATHVVSGWPYSIVTPIISSVFHTFINIIDYFHQTERERERERLLSSEVKYDETKNITFHLIRVKMSRDSWCSRTLLMNVVIESAHCDCERNSHKDLVWSKMYGKHGRIWSKVEHCIKVGYANSRSISSLVPQGLGSHCNACELSPHQTYIMLWLTRRSFWELEELKMLYWLLRFSLHNAHGSNGSNSKQRDGLEREGERNKETNISVQKEKKNKKWDLSIKL